MCVDLVQQLIGQGLGHIDQIQRRMRQGALGAALLVGGLVRNRRCTTQHVGDAQQGFFAGVGRVRD